MKEKRKQTFCCHSDGRRNLPAKRERFILCPRFSGAGCPIYGPDYKYINKPDFSPNLFIFWAKSPILLGCLFTVG